MCEDAAFFQGEGKVRQVQENHDYVDLHVLADSMNKRIPAYQRCL